MLSNRGFEVNVYTKKCPNEGVIVPTPLYGTEAWGMSSDERRKVNVLDMTCLRSLAGVTVGAWTRRIRQRVVK